MLAACDLTRPVQLLDSSTMVQQLSHWHHEAMSLGGTLINGALSKKAVRGITQYTCLALVLESL